MNYDYSTSPKFMVLDDGSNAPVFHQRTIAQLTSGLYPLFRAGTILLEPLPEMMVGEYSSPTPDITLYDNATEETPVIIEVCQTRGVKADLDKVVRLIDGELYGIREGFVYDYRSKCWFHYQLGDGGLTTESSYSEVLGVDLNQFLV